MKDTPIVWAKDFKGEWLDGLPLHKIQQGHRYKDSVRYIDIITAFDIETTTIEIDTYPHSFMYIWQWQFGDKVTVMGRTWDEFLGVYTDVTGRLSEDRKMVCYVHNLSYEFQYLAGVLDMESAKVFATDERNVLYMDVGNISFRCSYRLSNCSLETWTKDLGVDHQKLPDFNYSKIRYPWTAIEGVELDYCRYDVIGVVECIEKTLKRYNDSLYTIPLTSTGYVRRLTKKAMHNERLSLQAQQNSLKVYDYLRLAYRGGDTHANRYEVGNVITRVYSYDRSSSYPDVMMHCKFPVSRFKQEEWKSLDCCEKLVKAGRCYLAKVAFMGLHVKNWNTCPYISLSKCHGGDLITPAGVKVDNGRVLSAEFINCWVTDVDMALILREYDFEYIEIVDLYSARYGFLPKPIRELIKQLYRDKTELKGIAGKEEQYMMSKALLNSIYGMMCQRVITPEVQFIDGEWVSDDDYDREEAYTKAIGKAFLNYAWGVWVCAWARYRLHEGIDACGWDSFVYCDTDSVKSMDEPDLTAFNQKRVRDAKKSGAYATDKKGIVHYMGVFEKEDTYDKFITLGAKRYAYEIDGKMGMTVAGVSKKAGHKELEKMGGLEAFQEGAQFVDSGHIAAYYNDKDNFDYEIDGHIIHFSRNVSLVEKPYTMTLSLDLHNMIDSRKKALDRMANLDYNDIVQ